MERYFINIDFYNGRSVSKFIYTVIEADLDEVGLSDIARQCLEKEGLDPDAFTINVKAFNRI